MSDPRTEIQSAIASLDAAASSVFDATVEIKRSKIELWVDGAHIGTFVDDGVQFGPVYKSGKIGLYCEDARVQWDDVKVVGV